MVGELRSCNAILLTLYVFIFDFAEVEIQVKTRESGRHSLVLPHATLLRSRNGFEGLSFADTLNLALNGYCNFRRDAFWFVLDCSCE